MDERLKTTLDKIIKLTKENPEFDTELRKRLNISSANSVVRIEDSSVLNIEHYLGIDYSLDSKQSCIDYSFIENEEIRAILIADNREMMRCRYGTRFHQIDFKEYCRYAQLQAEMLLNYYYTKKCSSIEEIKNYIIRYNPGANINSAQTVGAISFSVKIWAFKVEHEIKKELDVWEYVREIRNDLSHRSPEKEDITKALNYKETLEGWKMPLKKNGEVNWYLIKDDIIKCNIYKTKIQNDKDYKKYLFLFWWYCQPFDEVQKAITTIISHMR